MDDKKKYVTNVWCPAEYDREGDCPHCNMTVFIDHNKNYCGHCGEKIYWTPEDIEGAIYPR